MTTSLATSTSPTTYCRRSAANPLGRRFHYDGDKVRGYQRGCDLRSEDCAHDAPTSVVVHDERAARDVGLRAAVTDLEVPG